MEQTVTHNTKWWSGGKSPFNIEYGKIMMWYFLLSDSFTFGAFLISLGTVRFGLNYWPEPSIVFNTFPFAGHANLPLAFVSVMTFVLIISSVTMVLAVHAGHNRDRKGVEKYLLLTIIGGLIFLSCQAWEWTHLLTAKNPVLVGDHIEVMAQRNGFNPWGEIVLPQDVAPALAKTSPETLATLVHEQHLSHASHAELLQTPKDQLIQLLSNSEMVVRKPGPAAFGGFFYGITGFHGFHVSVGVILLIIMLIQTKMGVYDRRGHYLMIEKIGLYWHFVDLVWVFVFLCFYLV
ncbi:cytochrome c oxidase subunit 3 [Niabella pedocola]|uniref:Cytochrome c oxidase subunit 3 n=1 Tax=Niabella pedocola TaxID=1752077 RepID=A0ABS8PWJ0_9BACT|nr:cytochrome c oxidase subunit 3 [Niabella pedocola]MBO9593838.1 cytochrome c oxidase subunit 3 [Niabella sp.]MCD2424688.1 cytochrome c oxidase subunit 3 [Niabella pedocola]